MRARSLVLVAIGLSLSLFACPRAPESSSPPPIASAPAPRREVPSPLPTDAGSASWDGAPVDRAVEVALAERKLPGCVVVVGTHDRVLFRRAYGNRSVDPETEPMELDTVFDLASLTKPLATALSVAWLEEKGIVSLDDRVSKYIAAFGAKGKETITLRHLLLHTSGLPAVMNRADFSRGATEAMRRIGALHLGAAPGARYRYSDIGFVVLGEVVARASGRPLDAIAREAIYEPLDLRDTTFLPPAAWKPRVAPTERRFDGVMIRGDVHDPIANALGGVAGNAGLFSTGDDVAKLAQMLLGRGARGGKRVLAESTVRKMFTVHDVPAGLRALGWDVKTTLSLNRSERYSRRAVGHGGYTGTALWLDPSRDLFVAFLSNRVHPDGKGAIAALAAKIGTAVVDAADLAEGRPIAPPECEATTSVRVGVDALAAEGFRRLRDKKVALLSNGGARARDGRTTFKVLKEALGERLKVLFVPEHGFGADQEGKITDGELEGVPVKSLYGARLSPDDAALAPIDVLVVDLPDVGARFFTYGATLHKVLRAASGANKVVLVLDRPNPLGGAEVDGPVEIPQGSFVQHHPLPLLHGMTLGELAWLLDADGRLGTDLDVVTTRGWRRGTFFDETGLKWAPPSPNLITFGSALAYAATALVEGTNVSVGRGTSEPFEVLGAPWLDSQAVARSLGAMGLSGVTFEGATITPTTSRYAGQAVPALRLKIVDRPGYRPIRTGLGLAAALYANHSAQWDTVKLDEMIGRKLAAAVREGQGLPALEASYRAELAAFAGKRSKHLLYGACSPAGGVAVGDGGVDGGLP